MPARSEPGHDRVGAGRDRLRDVARRGEAAVRDHRHVVLRGHPGAIVDRRDLRDADACDDARRADRARPHADLERVRAEVDQRLRRLGGRDVADDELDVEALLERAGHGQDVLGVAVGGVEDEHVDARLDERGRALERVRADADGGADAQPAARVLGRAAGTRCFLAMSLTVISPRRIAVRVDDRQLLDLVAVQDLLGLLERRADRRGDEVPRGHQLGDGAPRDPSRSGGRGS